MTSENSFDNVIQYFDNTVNLVEKVEALKVEYQLVFLCDTNSYEHCFLPFFKQLHSDSIVVPNGDLNKSFESLAFVCKQLIQLNAHKKTLLVNLGGGMISDLGGFAASVYKRGIPFINIPTSLLGMCDASYGGKTAINLPEVKNCVGSFYNPLFVWICPDFLKSLPVDEWKSAWGEILKMLLLFYPNIWSQNTWLSDMVNNTNIKYYIQLSLNAKKNIVTNDPLETNVRKVLNYGHSLGHAIEAVYNNNKQPVLHGNAVLWGMQLENKIACKLGLMSSNVCKQVNDLLNKVLPLPIQFEFENEICNSLLQDKKNEQQNIRMSLLSKPGSFELDVHVPLALVKEVILNGGSC